MNETDEVPVLVADLRMLLRALNAAYTAQASWDLLNTQRSMGSDTKESNLTRALRTAHDRVAGYIAEAETPEPIEDPEEAVYPGD